MPPSSDHEVVNIPAEALSRQLDDPQPTAARRHRSEELIEMHDAVADAVDGAVDGLVVRSSSM